MHDRGFTTGVYYPVFITPCLLLVCYYWWYYCSPHTAPPPLGYVLLVY